MSGRLAAAMSCPMRAPRAHERARAGSPVLAALAVAAATLPWPAAAAPVEPPLSMLMWNPHWQCFVWNQHNCSTQVENSLGIVLAAADADFAAVVELEDANYLPPSSYGVVKSACGHDLVSLFHNDRRWRPAFNVSVGCMISNDRPFVVQTYEGLEDPHRRVIVAGAHFPHPDFDGRTVRGDMSLYREHSLLGQLKDALKREVDSTGVEKVILIADTNAWDWVPSSEVMRGLGVGARAGWPRYLSTSLELTCCYDVGFPSWGTFDRIIANFGDQMLTSVLFRDELPLWAQQIAVIKDETKKGAFHRPVVGTLLLEPIARGGYALSLGLSALGGAATVCVCLLLYWAGTWASGGSLFDGKRGRHDVRSSDSDSSASE